MGLPHRIHAAYVRVHPKMMAQDMTGAPLDHALGQSIVHHARQWLGQRRIAHHRLDPGPKALNQLRAGEGREILQLRGRGIDDIIHRFGICRIERMLDIRRDPGFGQRGGQNHAIILPIASGRGKQDANHRPRCLWTWADWTSPNAASKTSIEDPP